MGQGEIVIKAYMKFLYYKSPSEQYSLLNKAGGLVKENVYTLKRLCYRSVIRYIYDISIIVHDMHDYYNCNIFTT